MNKPYLTVLNFSGGKQSSALLWMVLLNKISIDRDKFVVLNANPGMENYKTYEYVNMMFKECKKQEIECYTVEGDNLYEDIINLKNTNKTRFDNPPYWTKDENGKFGKLIQKCTYRYKIIPMDKKIRDILEQKFGISRKSKRIGYEIVHKWIGFSYSEVERIKPSKQKYIKFIYPLIDLRMSNKDVLNFFIDNHLPIPPRSVCNACFANGLDTLRDMYNNRPDDWNNAVLVDKSIRDLKQIGVKNEVYVSNTLIPLEDLAKINFSISKDGKNMENDYSCDSGYCFV